MSESPIPATDDDDKGYIFCELCRESLQELSTEDRQAHYEAHFNIGDGLEVNGLDAQLAASIAIQNSSPSRGVALPTHSNNRRVIAPQKPRENVFWHPACGLPAPGRPVTPGIIPILGRALERPGSRGGALCSPLVTHYGTELWDLGWGCGYRNFLMACSALAAQDIRPEYRGLLMDDICGPPGVRNLQVWIEDAWRRGYDAHGAAQLSQHLIGTRKWIGTAELYVAFTSRGIPRPSAVIHKVGLKVYASGVSSISSNTVPHPRQHQGSPTKAKDFFKRVIKRRSRSRLEEQVSKRVRGGTAEADDWEASGKGKGHKLNGSRVEDQGHNGPGPLNVTDSSSHTNSGKRPPKENIDLLATLQDLDLGRVLSMFRVTASQLSKKDQYQILWFPMAAPLTGPERDACKVVRSERVTVSPAQSS